MTDYAGKTCKACGKNIWAGDEVSDAAIAAVEDWINDLLRKIFNYHSSAELFRSVLFDIAI